MANHTVAEEWRPVVGYEGVYEVSNLGRIRSKDRITKKFGRSTQTSGKILRPGSSNGYAAVELHLHGCSKHARVHRIVAQAFIENPQQLPQVNHLNGIRSDNRIENLEWANQSMNERHAYDFLGKVPLMGEGKSNSVLTAGAVRVIRRAVGLGLPKRYLGLVFGVSDMNIRMIVSGVRWGHVEHGGPWFNIRVEGE